MGVPNLTVENFEADDVLGTLAVKACAAGFDVAIVTGDEDFLSARLRRTAHLQPEDDERHLVRFRRRRHQVRRRPDRVVDVLALMGDSIDNIKGVPGIGEKGARELIAAHGSLEGLLAAAPTLPQKRYREALTQFAEDARASRVLPHRFGPTCPLSSTPGRCAIAA